MTSFDINTTGDDVLKHFSKYAKGKTFVITGPSENGIGAESAITLASAKPQKIILVGRTESKVISVIEAIRKINPDIEVFFVEIDLLNNKSVRQAAEKIKTLTDKIDVLINNAGVMAVKYYATSVDGVESQFAANYLGHFLLTNLLDGETYNPWVAYGQAKTAMVLFNLALDKRLKQKGVTALICHPGGNPLPPQNMVTLKQAAGVVLFTALNPSLPEAAPAFIVENEIYTETKDYALNKETAEGLWKLSEKLVGETFVY
ncbi:uncharacterized protein EAF02_004984 [Botrytis sinoallii]|uniref:uncharacterized protein n=1 Tax=Botrytis sinoallii TaxID=1463999 RepID=UPI0018FF24C9|nr:uncharacterized protein EAF02_004984 [Botrytis sinoallii]KAF7884648.1 hypothetical protein EAF02_004984 [Botrytis sinoallii]